MDYWNECTSEAFDEAGITATKEQIDIVADCTEGAHDNYGMAHGHDCIPNPLKAENDDLKRSLRKEQEKVPCKPCKGRGRIIENGPGHSYDSECSRCRGEGRHSP